MVVNDLIANLRGGLRSTVDHYELPPGSATPDQLAELLIRSLAVLGNCLHRCVTIDTASLIPPDHVERIQAICRELETLADKLGQAE